MSSFRRGIDGAVEGQRAFIASLRATEAVWQDRQRRTFDQRTAEPLVRELSDLVRELEDTAHRVEAALRSL